MKKLVSLVLALIMTTALLTIGTNAAWEDEDQVKNLEEAQLLTDSNVKLFYVQSGNKWMPNTGVSRAYACRIAAFAALGMEAGNALPKEGSFPDIDVTKTNNYSAAVKWCKDQGIVSGYADGTFGPTKLISRDAFLKMMLGALGYKAAEQGYNKPETWRWEVLSDAQAAGLLDGVEINDVVKITRDEAVKVTMNTLMAIPFGGTEPLYKTSYPALLG